MRTRWSAIPLYAAGGRRVWGGRSNSRCARAVLGRCRRRPVAGVLRPVAQASPHELLNLFAVEHLEEGPTPRGGTLSCWRGSFEQWSSDVVLESVELVGESRLRGSEVGRGGLDAGGPHRDVETVETKPSPESTFDSGSNVSRGVGVEGVQHLGEAGDSLRSGGDAEPPKREVDHHLADSQFSGDVAGCPQAVAVLFSQPVGIDPERGFALGRGDSGFFGEAGHQVSAVSGGLADLGEAAPAAQVLAVEDVVVERVRGVLPPLPGRGRCRFGP